MPALAAAQEMERIGSGVRQAQSTALLSQLRGSALAGQITLARQLLFPAAHEFQATRDLAPPLESLRKDLRTICEGLGYYERAISSKHTMGSALTSNLATTQNSQALHTALSSRPFARTWGRLAALELAAGASDLAKRADEICDALTIEFSPHAPKCVLPLMLATQTAMESGAALSIQANRAARQGLGELAGASNEFIVELSGSKDSMLQFDPAVVRINMALREHGGYAGLACRPIVFDPGNGQVDFRLVDQATRQAARLADPRPVSVTVKGTSAVARQVERIAGAALAGSPQVGIKTPPAPQAAVIR